FPPTPSPAPELKVMTWNIRGGQSHACRPIFSPAYLIGIAKEIRTHAGLDVVALQEVYRGQVNLLKPMLFPHLGSNPDIHFVATLSCDRDRPGDDFGVAIISRHQFLEGSKMSERLCTTPFCPRDEPRVLARGIIRVDGHRIHIYNTHLPPGGGAHSRMAGLITRQVRKDQPVRAVLMGDFYMDDESAAYKEIRSEFRDAWKGASDDERKACDNEGNTHPTLPKPTQREDYVFISKDGFRVDGARVTCTGELLNAFNLTRRSRVPDHLPLTIRLALT
ncbi:MAG TPA: endonuclease/exonuclease/phosphatase family protein, partial [Pyrinomonadaceae bacterium]|nr:endonuclease/exonuclease/phosphatase family protein [Pyrinomonadaceae bacterium]